MDCTSGRCAREVTVSYREPGIVIVAVFFLP
jgi:hypothetical protein